MPRSVTRLSIALLALAVAGPVELFGASTVAAADVTPVASESPVASPATEADPTPTPSRTPTPTATPTPTPTASPTPTATPSPTSSPTPTPTASPTPTPTPTPSPTPSPTPTPFGAFTNPSPGTTHAGTPGATTIRWTETSAVTNRTLRQYYAGALSGSCSGVTWTRAWTRAVATPAATVRNMVPGVCYRYTVTATAVGTGTVGVIASGTVRVPGSWAGSFDLYRGSAFSTQRRWYWCVPASVQMMLNLINGTGDRSWTNQNRYYLYGRPRRYLLNGSRGLDPKSWTETLNRFGGGDYRVVTSSSLSLLLRYAARRNRLTGKPVGLLVARGGHAWVMTGFRATADPALTGNYRLISVRTMGPLWPKQQYRNRYFDSPPGASFGMERMAALYGRYYDSLGRTPWTGKYVIISP